MKEINYTVIDKKKTFSVTCKQTIEALNFEAGTELNAGLSIPSVNVIINSVREICDFCGENETESSDLKCNECALYISRHYRS